MVVMFHETGRLLNAKQMMSLANIRAVSAALCVGAEML